MKNRPPGKPDPVVLVYVSTQSTNQPHKAMSRGAAPEVTAQTRAWIRGKNDAEAGRDRQAPSEYGTEQVEAYASGYDSVSQDQ